MSKKLLEPFSRIGISCGNFGWNGHFLGNWAYPLH
jgi:hypothetical protein